jgi:hypothetical protein
MFEGAAAGVGLLVAAGVLGVTHGIEPDHAVGISALTTDAEEWHHAAVVGGCFAAGHVLIVLAWVAGLTAVGMSAGGVPEAVERAGSVLPGGVMLGVGGLLAVTGTSRLYRGGSAERGTVAGRLAGRLAGHDHTHAAGDEGASEGHPAGLRRYLRTGVVGSAFALSPPVSMLALVSTVLPTAGLASAVSAVGVYAAALTATMVLVGGGLGGVFASVSDRGRRAHAVFEVLTSVVVIGFALHLLL